MVKYFSSLAVAGAAVAAIVVGVSTPAMAAGAGALDTNKKISLPNGRGTMTYIDDGDMFQVCDTRADGHGVTGQLRNGASGFPTMIEVTDGGDAGCDKKGYNVGNHLDEKYMMWLWWNGGGDAVVSEWFNE
ncbi:hypothetical protein ACIRF8_34175 [Streptomyces sp. NPDC102406]|uniref:hypothetical protein n=1 Tax=Streptomyces sp. NPDC102406 TaxID=3366171 RepID=UPI00382CF60B